MPPDPTYANSCLRVNRTRCSTNTLASHPLFEIKPFLDIRVESTSTRSLRTTARWRCSYIQPHCLHCLTMPFNKRLMGIILLSLALSAVTAIPLDPQSDLTGTRALSRRALSYDISTPETWSSSRSAATFQVGSHRLLKRNEAFTEEMIKLLEKLKLELQKISVSESTARDSLTQVLGGYEGNR